MKRLEGFSKGEVVDKINEIIDWINEYETGWEETVADYRQQNEKKNA